MASPPYPAVSRWMLRHLNRAADLLPVVPARLVQAWHVWTSLASLPCPSTPLLQMIHGRG